MLGFRKENLVNELELSALDDLILGRGVKRGRHDLPSHLLDVFRERLVALGFRETTVGKIDIEVGIRVPAWVVRGTVADFGTVFWEVFTHRAKRKLFGSERRNQRKEWDIQLYPTHNEVIFAAPQRAESYDATRPIGIY